MRLIDADVIPALFDEEFKETRKLIQQGETHLDNLAEGFTEAARVIRQMPTVDAVPVVRCKDCKWLYDEMAFYCCRSHRGLVRICADSFCCYGERKEDK